MDDDATDNHLRTTGPQTDAQTGPHAEDRAGDHAVVLGAGMAGLLAARVLAMRFPRVTLIERDELPQGEPVFRPGIPQSRHAHILWSRGVELIELMLPGITDKLVAAGAGLFDSPRDFLWLSPADWFGPVSGARVLLASRELLDSTVRAEVLRNARVRVRSGATATGLVAGPDGRTVTGVELRGGERLAARLVVDATGRSSKAPAWLTALGHPAPAVTRYDSHLGYSSRYFEIPKDPDRRWQGMYVQGRPELPRGGVLMPLDGDRWLVTLVGNGEHAPPVQEEEFLPFARSLRSPALYDAIRDAVPLSSPTAFRNNMNEWRHYERLEHWPAGFVVLGDAACRVNPVYGHGMTVAALAAETLAKEIRTLDPEQIAAASRRIQRRTLAAAAVPWQIATSEDMRYPVTEGPPPDRATRILQRYMSRVMAGANADQAIAARFFGVLSLTRPPGTLLDPVTMLRVLSKRHLPTTPETTAYPAHHAPPVERHERRNA
ncbi:FAD-dependent monooxygenase [Streptomyces sp. NBC_00335]|uniref:NAD(P)/FAD-dependent oxidoreductase n=1 Tax=unclassified Streptomyces TaxID=2593676 RepID=UPI0022597684|nr:MULTISPECIES: FAD-dependent monooxygenase [unclassified Streptomyces]MCX5403741.1 FAD-dependent monooxygenase [Streptomyces sp. NBC_00086]